MSVNRAAAMAAALMIGGVAVPAQAQDCRSIADATQRLACYDQQQGGPAAAAVDPAQPQPNRTGLREPKAPKPPKVAEAKAKSGFSSTIVGISPLSFGLFELRLADGSVWSTTTSSGRRPVVGDAITYRRSMLGAHFFDIKGQGPVTVRRER